MTGPQRRAREAVEVMQAVLSDPECHPASMLLPSAIAAVMECLLNEGYALGAVHLFVESQLVGSSGDSACVTVLQCALQRTLANEKLGSDDQAQALSEPVDGKDDGKDESDMRGAVMVDANQNLPSLAAAAQSPA